MLSWEACPAAKRARLIGFVEGLRYHPMPSRQDRWLLALPVVFDQDAG